MHIFIAFSILSIHCFSNTFMPGYPDYVEIAASSNPSSKISYPAVNSSGFVEMKVSGRDNTDDLEKLDMIRSDEYYNKIPKDVVKGTLKFDTRYNIFLDGHLDEDTSILYNIQKEPDYPGKYNVKIKKNTSEIQFGDFSTDYTDGDFINTRKSINGVEVHSIQNKWSGKATLGVEKSEPQKYESYGTGTRQYSVGKSFLLEGSVTVYVNNIKQSEDRDYIVNYYDGNIIFSTNIQKTDFIKVIYEFTNPVQDFIPALSRKNFTGLNYVYNPSMNITVETPIVATQNETITIHNQTDVLNNAITLSFTPIINGTESIHLNSQLLKRNIDYLIKYDSGHIRFLNTAISFNDTLKATYQSFITKKETEQHFGNGTPGPYTLNHASVLPDTIDVYINNKKAKEFIDYIYSPFNHSIQTYYNIPLNMPIRFSYQYKDMKTTQANQTDAKFALSVTYLDEKTSIRDELYNTVTDQPPQSVSSNTITLNHNPIDSFISLSINDQEIESSEYTIDHYTGIIYLNNQRSPTIDQIKTSYTYISGYPTEFSFKGINGKYLYSEDDINLRSLPVKYKGIDTIDGIKLFRNNNEIALEEGLDYIVNYGSDGRNYSIQFTPSIINSNLQGSAPNSSDMIKIKYLYSPSISDTEAESTHSITDISIYNKLTDTLSIYAEIANSNYSFSKTSTFQNDTFTTSPIDNKYQLTKFPIEENSELVFINGFSQTKDIDYYINYESGEIRLINKTIPDGFNVTISYNYFSSDVPNNKRVNAYSLKTNYTPSKQLLITNSFYSIDPNFIPIGSIQYNKGVTNIQNSLVWNINTKESIAFSHENETTYDTNYNQLLNKQKYLTNINIGILMFDTSHTMRYEHISASINYTEKPYKFIEYNNNITYLNGKNKTMLASKLTQKTEQVSEEDQQNSQLIGTKLSYLHYFSLFNLIKDNSITTYYSINRDKTNTSESEQYNQQTIETIGFVSSSQINQQLSIDNRFDQSVYNTEYLNNQSYNDRYYNYSHITNFSPFDFLSANLNISHNESISPIPGQEDTINDRQSVNIMRIAPGASLEYLNMPTWSYQHFRGSIASGGYIKTNTRENNANKFYNEQRYFGKLSGWRPMIGLNIPSIKFNTYQSTAYNKQTTATHQLTESNTQFLSYDTSIKYSPPSIKFISFDGSINVSDQSNIQQYVYTSGTENITTNHLIKRKDIIGTSIQFNEISFLPIPAKKPFFRYQKITEKQLDSIDLISSDQSFNSLSIDNFFKQTNAFQSSLELFNGISTRQHANDTIETYNRNKVSSTTGSLLKKRRNIDNKIEYSVFSFIKNTEYMKYEQLDQYKIGTINVSSDDITSKNDSKLSLKELFAQHQSEIDVFNSLSIIGYVEYQQFNQNLQTTGTISSSKFIQKKGGSGLRYTPLPSLELSYDYFIKHIESNQISPRAGYEERINIQYTPIKYKNFEILAKYNISRNWGSGFNDLQKDQLLQTYDENTALNIIQRDDEVQLGSINLNIILPIKKSEHLEKVIISGEGYMKRVLDELNKENEFFVTGLLFNVRMEL